MQTFLTPSKHDTCLRHLPYHIIMQFRITGNMADDYKPISMKSGTQRGHLYFNNIKTKF